jgi:galactoside 2-L-fucosyltransferase 1/2
MFIFASAFGLARTHACQMYIGQRLLTQLTETFQIKIPSLLTESEVDSLKGIVQRSTICAFYPDLLKPDAIQSFELAGYWQTYGYFIKFKDEIRQQFSFQTSILKVAASYFHWWTSLANACCYGHCLSLPYETRKCFKQGKVRPSLSDYAITASGLKRALFMTNFTWIGVHVRRTNFYKDSVSDDAYILKAMKYFSQKYQNTIFIIASDDKRYCEQKFREKKNVIVTPRYFSASEDMAILSFCQHSIITAGTYGWWSAFLADGDVLHDNRYMQKKSETCDCDPIMYFPPWFLFP